MEFEVDDLVWAKMKGFPPWPARIAEKGPNVKAPKNEAGYVFLKFFGTADVAWILKKDVTPHSKSILQDLKDKKKTKKFQQSIDELLMFLGKTGKGKKKSLPKVKEVVGSKKKSLPKVEEAVGSKKRSLPKVKAFGSKKRSLPKVKAVVGKKKSLLKVKEAVVGKKKSLPKVKEAVCSKRKSLAKVKEAVGSKKKSLPKVKAVGGKKKRLIVKIIKTAPNKRQILNNEKSRIKRVTKRKSTVKRNQSLDNSLVSNQQDSDISEKPNPLLNITYGFMGLSTFGRAVLLKLVRSGIQVFLYDPSIDEVMNHISGIKEITRANSPAELIKICDVTFCCYEENSSQFADIVYGTDNIIQGFDEAERLGRRSGYVQLTYIDIKTSEMINKAAIVKNIMYLEAPIHGSCEDIATGEAVINASGHQNLFTKCEKVFDLLSNKYFFIGYDIGISSYTNMLLNAATGTINAAISETMTLADRLNVDLSEKNMKELVEHVFKKNDVMETVERMGNRITEPVMPLRHVQKNISLGLLQADKVNQRMPMTAAANELYKRGRQLNYSDDDVSAIYKVIKY